MPNQDPVAENIKRIVSFGLPTLLGVFFLIGSCYSVDQGERAVITRFGAIRDVAEPGLHFKAPIIDSKTTLNVQTSWIEWKEWREENQVRDSRMESYSNDQQPAHIGVKITYHLKSDIKSITEVFAQYRDQAGFEQNVLIPRAYEAIKVTFGKYTAINVVRDRDGFIAQVNHMYRELIGNGPVVIEGVQIQDIKFSNAYEQAVEQRMQAEVEVAKVTQNLEKERKLAEMKVVQAEAWAKATKLKGEAEASAIRARSDALRDSPRLVELTAAEKWNGVLPTTMVPGSTVPFLGLGK